MVLPKFEPVASNVIFILMWLSPDILIDCLVAEFGLPVLPDRLAMMYPPTYDEATVHNTPMTMHKQTFVSC